MTNYDGYTVTYRDGCTLIHGSIPVTDFAALTSSDSSKGAVLSPYLAQLARATMAWGDADSVEALVNQLKEEALARVAAESPNEGGLSLSMRQWLAAGEQGRSSAAIFWRLTGVRPPIISNSSNYQHPLDAGDLRRCMLLLKSVPEFQGRILEMADCSAQWRALAAHWDELCTLLESECPQWATVPDGFSCQRTYTRIRELLDASRMPPGAGLR